LFRMLDPNYLEFIAQQNGMTPNGSYSEFNLLELQNPPVHEAPSNWFDRFSRFVSGIFR